MADDPLEDIEDEQSRVEGDQQEEQELHEEIGEFIQKVEQGLDSEKAEIQDLESDPDMEEERDAVRKEKSIEDLIEKQEELVAEAVRDLEDEMEVLHQEAYGFENADQELYQQLEEILEGLQKVKDDISFNGQNANRQVIDADLQEFSEVLKSLEASAQVFQDILEHQQPFIQELHEFEKEDLRMENIIDEMMDELEMTKEEVKELLLDSEQMGDQEAYQQMEAEKDELQQIIQKFQEERGEEQKVEQMLSDELQDSEKIIQEDGKILQEFDTALSLLDDIHDLLVQNQDMLKPRTTVKIYQLINQVNSVRNELRNAIQTERTEWENLRDRTADTVNSAKKIWGQAAENSSDESWFSGAGDLAKYVLIAGVLIALGIYLRFGAF